MKRKIDGAITDSRKYDVDAVPLLRPVAKRSDDVCIQTVAQLEAERELIT